MRILHTADWHIGDFPGPSEGGANARGCDTLRCIDAMISAAKDMEIDLSIISGDIFHASRTWSERGIREVESAAERIRALSEIAPVVIIRGTPNHDGAEHFSMLQQYFSNNERIHILTKPKMIALQLKEAGNVCICGLPGFDKGYWRSMNPGIDKEQENIALSESINSMLVGLRALCPSGVPSILVGHYTVEGCNAESGQTMMFSQFEPTVNEQAIRTAGYDLCCFGHIHRPQKLGNNAFYAGAVNAMNFNDENQDRGFYVHTLEDGHLIDSSFHTLPYRRFKTIRLDDDNVRDLNASGVLPFFDVEKAVVRVLYSCSDESNKALNRAQLEKLLYNKGAFWVQEITPEKITVTVNKQAMKSDYDPESNLREYLLSIETPESDIEAMMPIAREIIAGVVQAGRIEKAHGAFVPVEISVTNYRNYREESFRFDDVSFCTINGQNGAGKSSLFCDALYDALYESPREGDLTGWICNDPEVKSGAIRFTFRVGDRMWRVVRTRVKSGKATLNLSEYADGEWRDRSKEKMRDTQVEIERVVGMDGLTLRACALIMQDQYGLFLQADKESRMKILSDILGLQIYEDMAELAAEKAADKNRHIRGLQIEKESAVRDMPDMDGLVAAIASHESTIISARAAAANIEQNISIASRGLSDAEAAQNTMNQHSRELVNLRDDYEKKRNAIVEAKRNYDQIRDILFREIEIVDGMKEYRAADAQRSTSLEKVNKAKQLEQRRDTLNDSLKSFRATHGIIQKQLAAADLQIETTRAKVESEPRLLELKTELATVESQLAGNDRLLSMRAELDRSCVELESQVRSEERDVAMKRSVRLSNIKNLEQRASLLENSGCSLGAAATCNFLADAKKAASALPEARRQDEELYALEADTVIALKSKLQKKIIERDSIPTVEASAVNVLKSRQQTLLRACMELDNIPAYKASLERLEADRASIADHEASLQHDIDITEKVLQDVIDKLEPLIDASETHALAVGRMQELERYKVLEEKLFAAKASAPIYENRIRELQGELDLLDTRIGEKQIVLHKAKEDALRANEWRTHLESLSLTKQRIAEEIEKAQADRALAQAALDRANELSSHIAALSKRITEASTVATYCDTLKRAFSNNGIPHSIVRSVVPVLEATASNILGQMSGGKMSVELVTEKVMKSNSKKEVVTLDVLINDSETGRLPYLSRSGGERVKVALSVILALAEVKSADIGVQIGFRFIDEPPFLDAAGVQAYCDALETIQRRYSDIKVMIITHDEAMKSRFPQSVDVSKDESGSHAVLN